MNTMRPAWRHASAAGLLVLALAACGGGSDEAVPTERSVQPVAERTTKSAASRVPVYRFYNTRTGAHFYTVSEAERTSVQATLPHMSFEGVAFHTSRDALPGLLPVHRFFNTRNGVHFFTISDSERASIVASPTMRHMSYEGIAYYASVVSGYGFTPLYRFYVAAGGFHFYTASESEKNSLIATASATHTYEGVAYQALASSWREMRVPHSYVTADQCHQAGVHTLITCSNVAATSLNPFQDGHRANTNPQSYGTVYRLVGLTPIPQPSTSCVFDGVTGLTWEGKTNDGGARDKDLLYTNVGNGATGDSSAHVAAVNASALCGYNDWRLPSRNELLSLLNFGDTAAPLINGLWFGNAVASPHWTSTPLSTDATKAWSVRFDSAPSSGGATDLATPQAVRLVRGQTTSGPRYTFSSVSYAGDAANNTVNDGWTGLQWRRCLQGQIWNGSACTGDALDLTHEQALADAATRGSNWRMPNIRELSSLVDLTRTSGASIDPMAFPGAPVMYTWSGTPNVVDSAYSRYVSFVQGEPGYVPRTFGLKVRLVR